VSTKRDLPDFKAQNRQEHARLGEEGMLRFLDAGRAWDLAPALRAGGSIIFPHAGMAACGHQIAAAVHACLDCGAERVLVVGVLHALTEELDQARIRVANGADVTQEPYWGIQGPGLGGRSEWEVEFSLDHFLALWEAETRRRGVDGPERIVRYPYLAGGRPEILPGIGELVEIAGRPFARQRDLRFAPTVVVGTGDIFHHGIGYGDPPERAFAPQEGGLDLGRKTIQEGLDLLRDGDYWGYNQHCVEAKSDARDVGQVIRYLLGPLEGQILDIVADDMTGAYGAPAPTWVAGTLVRLDPV
jgi:hypothetical protein